MSWKQFLTEKVLKEQWHYTVGVRYSEHFGNLEKCSCGRVECDEENRTFDNRSDLMDLYQKIYEDGKWDDFFWDFAFKRKPENYGLGEAETSVWLFCLNGKDYEPRCKMVAAFYGWEAGHD